MVVQLNPMQGVTPAHNAPTRPSSSYEIGPIDPSELILMQAHCSSGEVCPLLTPKQLPLWILNHPEFRDGYEMNYFSEEEGMAEEWSTVSHMVNQVYSKLLGEGFADLSSGVVDPGFGPWEIGYLLREFTRLADTDRTLALTGIAHLCFLISFLPAKPPACWPPLGLIEAQGLHNTAVKAYRARLRGYREQGKSYAEAERLALVQVSGSEGEPPDHTQTPPPVTFLALLEHPEFREGLAAAHERFLEEFDPVPLTEDEMISEVVHDLTYEAVHNTKRLHHFMGWEPFSYLRTLGYILGTIDKGLTYAGSVQAMEVPEC